MPPFSKPSVRTKSNSTTIRRFRRTMRWVSSFVLDTSKREPQLARLLTREDRFASARLDSLLLHGDRDRKDPGPHYEPRKAVTCYSLREGRARPSFPAPRNRRNQMQPSGWLRQQTEGIVCQSTPAILFRRVRRVKSMQPQSAWRTLCGILARFLGRRRMRTVLVPPF